MGNDLPFFIRDKRDAFHVYILYYIYIYIYINTCIYIYIYIHTCIYIYIYIHTYIYCLLCYYVICAVRIRFGFEYSYE